MPFPTQENITIENPVPAGLLHVVQFRCLLTWKLLHTPTAGLPQVVQGVHGPFIKQLYFFKICCRVTHTLQVYRKSYKEFTDLRLVQQLGGHSGVVWALKFSRNGRFLASGGCSGQLSNPELAGCMCAALLSGHSQQRDVVGAGLLWALPGD